MLNIVLNIIGIILIIYALTIIKKDEKRIRRINDGNLEPETLHKQIDEFSDVLQRKEKEIDNKNKIKNIESIEIFSELNDSLEHKNKTKLNNNLIEETGYSSIIKNAKIDTRKTNYNNEKIIELKEMGYSNEDIAKRTKRSVREIEVILKIYV